MRLSVTIRVARLTVSCFSKISRIVVPRTRPTEQRRLRVLLIHSPTRKVADRFFILIAFAFRCDRNYGNDTTMAKYRGRCTRTINSDHFVTDRIVGTSMGFA